MRQLAPAILAALSILPVSVYLRAQEAGPAHAPDGRAPQLISPLYFSPKPNAPFNATARTVWVRTLPDGSTVTSENARSVSRDAEGRIFEQRVTFVPVPNTEERQMRVHATDYYDPIEHTHYHCDTASRICDLFNYYVPVNDAVAPAGLQADKTTFLTRNDLGIDTFAGLDVQRSRETTTLYTETVGNTRTILRTVDYWYSPVLGVNVQVKRHDPRDGDQTLWLTDVSLTAADPDTFKVPAGYRILDHRPQTPKAPAVPQDLH
jgi:hypothetical protein